MKNIHRRSTIDAAVAAILGLSLCAVPAAPVRAAEGAFHAFMEVVYGIQPGDRFEFVDTSDIQGNYDFSIVPELSQLPGSLRVTGQGDPFFEYALFLNNVASVTGTLIYEFTIDIVPVPVPPGSPDLLMRSTLEYSVEDTDGDGSAMLVPDPFAGLQQAVLSDDRTNVVSDLSLFLGFDALDAPGDAPPSDTGLLPLLNVPPLPPGMTIESYGVLGIRGSFDLSPGDTAVVTGRFEIVPDMTAGLPGDYNQDGTVNAADYVVFRANDVANNPLPNDNGVGTQAERYDLWTANFDQGPPGAGAGADSVAQSRGAVPEPSTLALLLIASAAVGMTCTRSRRLWA